MALITVGSTPLPNPVIDGYDVLLSDLDSPNTVRSETGYLQRTRIRAGVYTIDATFKVTRAELKTITDAVKDPSFPVTFYDPTTDSTPTATMYVSDRRSKLLKYLNEADPTDSLWQLTLSLVEV